MNDKHEEEVSLNWARRRGRPANPKPAAKALPRIPRITRLMALAIKFQDMVDRGEVRDYADLARLGYVTRARVTQIMNLLNLAPDLQEQVLFSGAGQGAHMHPFERQLRPVLSVIDWPTQRRWMKKTLGDRIPT